MSPSTLLLAFVSGNLITMTAAAAVISSDVSSPSTFAGSVGIGTTSPVAGLDVSTTGTGASAIVVPRDTVANRPGSPVNGMIRYASDTSKLETYQAGSWQNVISGAASSAPLSGVTAATAANTIDNLLNAQTWSWSTATTQTPLTLNANALTTGSVLSLGSSNPGLNSSAGLLNVTNSGTSASGLVARIQSNSTSGSGLVVLANGNVGIGMSLPTVAADVNGGLRAGSSASVTSCGLGQSNGEGSQRYNYTNHVMEYCNGTSWVTAGKALSAGQEINKTIFKDCSRAALSNAASITIASFTVNKQVSSSILLIEGTVSGYGAYSGAMTGGWTLGSGTEAIAQSLFYEGDNQPKTFPTTTTIVGQTMTGSQTMVFRFFAQNGDTGQRPFVVYNPNSTDDARLSQTCSVYIISEIAQ